MAPVAGSVLPTPNLTGSMTPDQSSVSVTKPAPRGGGDGFNWPDDYKIRVE